MFPELIYYFEKLKYELIQLRMLPRLQLLPALFRACISISILATKAHTINPVWRTDLYGHSTVCDNKECEEHGKRLAGLMDHSLDPCDDFYQYVCGKWVKKNPMPPYYDEWSIDSQVQVETFKQVQEMLEEPIKEDDKPDMITAKEFHQECMKTPYFGIFEPSVIKHNVQPICYFPLITKQKLKNKNWQLVHNYYLSFTGESGLFSILLRGDRRNKNAPLLCVREVISPFGLIKGTKLTNDQQKMYFEFLMILVKEVMLPNDEQLSEADLKKGILAVIEFRMKLYKLKVETMSPNKIYSPITVGKLNERYNQKISKKERATAGIDWIQVIHHFLVFREKRLVIKNMIINNENRMYLQSLAALLGKTSADVIANHLHIYFIERHTALDPHLRNKLMDVVLRNGKLKGKIRYLGTKEAMCLLMNEMKETIEKNYVKRYFSPDVKKQTENLVKELKDVLKMQIKESTWLDPSLMSTFIKRVSNMNVVIGYPEYYIDLSKKFGNPMAAAMQPTKLDAFYLPASNVLSISAAYLKSPIYNQALPYAMRYSGLGEYIAHEMYHGFGPNAAKWIKQTNSWSVQMRNKYAEQMSCFINKFDKLPIQELSHVQPPPKIDGHSTLEENLSDLMALKLAYWAFRKKVWETKKCEVLPHMYSFTCDHLFFISFASFYCTTLTTDTFMVHLEKGEHSTPRLRVNEATSNFEVFKEVFHCKKPDDNSTCDLWK